MEPHVDGFAAFPLNAVCGNADGGSVVAHDDGRFLGIAHVRERGSK